jgi:hypothetical protein
MALRITTAIEDGTTVLRLHGWLLGPEIDAFEETCTDAALPARIDLRWLVGADAAGIRALRRASDRGIPLAGASPYLELLFRGEKVSDRPS